MVTLAAHAISTGAICELDVESPLRPGQQLRLQHRAAAPFMAGAGEVVAQP
jgi:hypothetical protein